MMNFKYNLQLKKEIPKMILYDYVLHESVNIII